MRDTDRQRQRDRDKETETNRHRERELHTTTQNSHLLTVQRKFAIKQTTNACFYSIPVFTTWPQLRHLRLWLDLFVRKGCPGEICQLLVHRSALVTSVQFPPRSDTVYFSAQRETVKIDNPGTKSGRDLFYSSGRSLGSFTFGPEQKHTGTRVSVSLSLSVCLSLSLSLFLCLCLSVCLFLSLSVYK